MTDWDEIVENIHNAMRAIDEASRASDELKQNTNHATFDTFRTKVAELDEHLSKLKMVLDNEEAYAMDELMDALSMVYSGHRAEYRRTPHMEK